MKQNLPLVLSKDKDSFIINSNVLNKVVFKKIDLLV